MGRMSLTREKLSQAAGLVAAGDADVWMTVVRESDSCGDPVLPLILEGGLTWVSALLVGRDGRKAAVVGNYDADPLRASGDWDEVVPYVESIREPLLAQLDRMVRPGGRIALNYSLDDDKADGLSHGLFLLLQSLLEGTRFADALVSAEPITSALRGQKSDEEIARIRRAIQATDAMFGDIEAFAAVGVSERAVFDHVHRLARERGLGFSWAEEGDPIVNSGPDSMVGHGIPSSAITIQPGHIFHVDLGLLQEGYASDIQSCWYVPHEGESGPPEDVRRACEAVVGAISAGAEALRPGAAGWEVDAAARAYLVAQGYPEYLHAFGHQVGRAAHDGGTLLGPRWDRYGEKPNGLIREREVYTLELGVDVPGRGYLGIEEMAVVQAGGIEWLTTRQTDMPLLRS